MKSVASFFDKFKNTALKEIKKRESICQAIFEATNYKIEERDITIRDCVITIKGNQGLKSELFMKKKAILNSISKRVSEKIVDIK